MAKPKTRSRYRYIRPDGTVSKRPYKTKVGAARGAVREKFTKGGVSLSGDSTFIQFAWNNLMEGYRIERVS